MSYITMAGKITTLDTMTTAGRVRSLALERSFLPCKYELLNTNTATGNDVSIAKCQRCQEAIGRAFGMRAEPIRLCEG